MDFKKRLIDLKNKLDFISKEKELKDLTTLIQTEDFWKREDQNAILKRQKLLNNLVEKVLAIELILLDDTQLAEAEKLLDELETLTYFDGKYDEASVFFSIHAGAGGVESMDFAAMLERMYLRFFEKRGFKYEMLDKNYGEEAGIKSVYFAVSGDFCFGFLKHEAGTHRLVRLSPYNANSLRQTSFAKVEVIPQVKKSVIEMKDSDLEITTMHSGGKGGQNVNKVETGVRVKYLPLNIVVGCTTSRSQSYNKELALQLLYSKVNEQIEKQNKESLDKLKGKNINASFGSQIRSYVLHPYSQVKDHRSNLIAQNAQYILEGNLDIFIDGNVRVLN
ncbi:PCRF domain-containing protein [Patescibacteria group bacterium]|nr:PCRF domain-containing protein [Patescibacteria group bacterium]